MPTVTPSATRLDGLSAATRVSLGAISAVHEHAAGDVILRDGLSTPALFLVETGRVALRLLVPGRGSLTILTVEAGELLGWSSVVPPYRATSEAVALEPTILRAFDAVALRAFLATDVDGAAELLPLLLGTVSDRLSTSWHQLLDLFGGSALEPW